MAFNFEIMKNLFCLCILLLIGSMQMSRASDKIEKQPLKVLYVGGSADIQVLNETISDSTALRKSIADRTAAFGEMLRQYFQTVKVVAAEDWTPEMSRAYDVTVMDGRPKAIKPAWQEKDASGKVIAYHSAVYLPESFDRPMVTIAEVGNTVGRGIGLKSDWYCLCLDADAHHWRAEHPIFKGPFPVKMTVRMCPTPSDAFHYAYFMDEPVPDSVLMWKVQNKGYQTHEGFRVGMVARPWGFEDSPDAEYISSGVCAKTLDAVAIGRHGNFLHWGFAASPADMTEEAKTVFANAIVYISRFAGQKPFVRKYNDRIATREYVKEQLYLSTREAWQEREKSDEEFAAEGLKLKKVVQEKQRRGEKLNRREEMFLNYEPQPPMSYADMLKRYQGVLHTDHAPFFHCHIAGQNIEIQFHFSVSQQCYATNIVILVIIGIFDPCKVDRIDWCNFCRYIIVRNTWNSSKFFDIVHKQGIKGIVGSHIPLGAVGGFQLTNVNTVQLPFI